MSQLGEFCNTSGVFEEDFKMERSTKSNGVVLTLQCIFKVVTFWHQNVTASTEWVRSFGGGETEHEKALSLHK